MTLAYLHDHPAELDDFFDFHIVQQHKLLGPIEDTFGRGTISQSLMAEVETRFDQVKHKFMVADCRKCGTQRLNHIWNKLDFVSLAKRTGSLGTLIVPGYYLPMRQAHATLASLLSRLEAEKSGAISFQPASQRREADDALITAHNILIHVLGIQDDRFRVPGLKEKLELCKEDFLEIYRDRPTTEATA